MKHISVLLLVLVLAAMSGFAFALGVVAATERCHVREKQERNERCKDFSRNYDRTIQTVNHIYDSIWKPCTN